MATISVPLSKEQVHQLDTLVAEGAGANRSEVMRRALEELAEKEVIEGMLQAEREIKEGKILRGNLRDILLNN